MFFNIWIDDMRQPPHKDNLVVFQNAESAIEWFKREEEITSNDCFCLYLDHDLGEGISGYDFCKWFIKWNYERQHNTTFVLLTANPVGRDNMRQLMTHYGYKETH